MFRARAYQEKNKETLRHTHVHLVPYFGNNAYQSGTVCSFSLRVSWEKKINTASGKENKKKDGSDVQYGQKF